jgi:endonuclease/exonuclease/phosphatase family metal-dependent hydrolase
MPDGSVRRTVRVLTWNLWWRFGDWQQRLKAIDAVLQEVQPDICCFQEVWSTDSEDAAARLGEQNGLPYVARSYSPEPERWQQWIDQPGVDYGNAIVSRWPITASHVRDLPGAHGRTALAARIATPAGAEIPVVCTHLAAHPAASAERCAQVRVVVDVVDALGRRDLPPVVAGDLNAEPDSDEVRLLSGLKTAPAVAGLFLLDAWRGAEDTDPGWTWRRENPHTSKIGLNARIDYLHVGAFGPNGEGTIRQVRLAGHHEVDGVWPSDHAAVVADLAMP